MDLLLEFLAQCRLTAQERLDLTEFTLEGDGASDLLPGAVGLDRLLDNGLNEIVKVILQELKTLWLQERQHHIDEHEVAEVNLRLLREIQQRD